MRWRSFLKAAVSALILPAILSANAKVLCKKVDNSMLCQVGSNSLSVFESSDALPIRLQRGDEYRLSSNIDGVECFRDSSSALLECIIKLEQTPKWHIVWKMESGQNDTPMLEVISYLKRGLETPQKLSAYDGLSADLTESKSRNSNSSPTKDKDTLGSNPTSNLSSNSTPTTSIPKSEPINVGANGLFGKFNTQNRSILPPTSTKSSSPLLASIPLKNRLMGDIDGDGLSETIAWKRFATTNLGDFYQLYVFDDDGRLLWKGPAQADSENRYIFGDWDFGESLPEALLDLDGDRQAELLAPSPQSDVSPVFYRIFGWNGKRFVERRPGVLMQSKDDPSRFVWVNPYPKEGDGGVWISRIIPQNSIYNAKVEVTEAQRGIYKKGRAIVRFVPWGARIIEWEKPLSPIVNSRNSGVKSLSPYSYIARISSKDHYNSRGLGLRRLIDILHQDRAYFYKGAADPEDTGNGLFSTLAARRQMDRMSIIAEGISLQELRRAVIGGTPLLRIEPNFSQNILRVFLLKP